MDNDVYWRPYITNDGVVAVCMQWFDEYDYDSSRYYNDKKYKTEKKCQKKCDKIIKKFNVTNIKLKDLYQADYTTQGI
jgi:hypothetical protein